MSSEWAMQRRLTWPCVVAGRRRVTGKLVEHGVAEVRSPLPHLERLPQHEGEEADQDAGLHAIGALLPDRAHAQLLLWDAQERIADMSIAMGRIAAYCRPENEVSLGFAEGLKNKIRVLQCHALHASRAMIASDWPLVHCRRSSLWTAAKTRTRL